MMLNRTDSSSLYHWKRDSQNNIAGKSQNTRIDFGVGGAAGVERKKLPSAGAPRRMLLVKTNDRD
jgi:hypothetical protein